MKIKVGDWVTVDAASYIDITENKKYRVNEVNTDYVEIIVDAKEYHDININNVTLAPKTTPRPHAELRKRWLDDDQMVIEVWSYVIEDWVITNTPKWRPKDIYREKPSEPTERDLIIQEAQDKLNAAKKRLDENKERENEIHGK